MSRDAEIELFCIDEGCPHAGTDHYCRTSVVNPPDYLQHFGFNCAGEVRPGPRIPYTQECRYTGFAKIPVPRVRDLGTAPRYAGVRMARALANQLARYAASLEKRQPAYTGDDPHGRATLAREMSVIYFRAAELEEKS